MDLVQMAGHLSLEFGAEVDGPYGYGTETGSTVRVWLSNGRGVSLTHRPDRDAEGEAEILVIREVHDGRGGMTSVHDYGTPVTSDVVPGADLDRMRAALAVLRDMPESNRYDLRTNRPQH